MAKGKGKWKLRNANMELKMGLSWIRRSETKRGGRDWLITITLGRELNASFRLKPEGDSTFSDTSSAGGLATLLRKEQIEKNKFACSSPNRYPINKVYFRARVPHSVPNLRLGTRMAILQITNGGPNFACMCLQIHAFTHV